MNQEEIDSIFNSLMVRLSMIDKRAEEFQTQLKIFFQEGIIKGQQYVLEKVNKKL